MTGYARTNCLLCGKASEGLPHFRFPFDVVLRSAWANACGIDPASVTKTQRLCCKHFSPENYSDYFIHNVETSRTRLKYGSIPTLGLPSSVDDDDDYTEFNESFNERVVGDNHIKQNKLDEDTVHSRLGNGAESDYVTEENESTQFSDLPEDSNVDNETENDNDDNDILVDYDEFDDDVPSELDLTDLTRFIKKKTRLCKNLQLSNIRLKRRITKVVAEYLEFGDERGTKLPALDDLNLDL